MKAFLDLLEIDYVTGMGYNAEERAVRVYCKRPLSNVEMADMVKRITEDPQDDVEVKAVQFLITGRLVAYDGPDARRRLRKDSSRVPRAKKSE